MNPAIYQMLAKYQIQTSGDAENALKEVIQEVALLGLHRAKFFEKAAFYGGTALRVLCSMPRYAEDLDFTLLKPNREFSLAPYFAAVDFEVEARYLLEPTSFPVVTLKKPDLFAGKLHALLFRQWETRIKGRDFYDYVWYLKNRVPARLDYLREKAIQSGHAKISDLQTLQQLKDMILGRMATIDFQRAKDDVLPFIKEPRELDVWGLDFFTQIAERIEIA